MIIALGQRGDRMNDMINRQDAIDAHCELCADKDMCSGDICPDVEVFQLLPSAQPEQQSGRIFQEIIVEYPTIGTYIEYEGKPYFSIKYTEGGKCFIGYGTYDPKVLSEYLKTYFLPSVQPEPSQVARDIATIIENEQDMRVILSHQPEIIRCKDCKHWDGLDTCDVIDAPVWDNDFCSMAERRSDE